jgi:HemK-like putative methylase
MLARLTTHLGKRQAALEWRWMKRAAPDPRALPDMVRRRCLGEPLQYILGASSSRRGGPSSPVVRTGTQPFGPLNLLVRPPVLIPRPETENWVIKLSETLCPTAQTPLSLLDLGTGSGCIPLLLCHLWPPGSLHAHGVDISTHAIRLANDNALLSDVPSASDGEHPRNTLRTTLTNFLSPEFPHDLSPIKPPFNIITSNPPYIPWKDFVDLPRSVSNFEDPKALFGGPSGLEFYEAIARLIAREGFLSPDGVVALEVGYGQSKAVEALIRTTGGMRHTQIWMDPWGVERAIFGRL